MELIETSDERGTIATAVFDEPLSADWDDPTVTQGDWLRLIRQEEELTIEPTLFLQRTRQARLVGNRISDVDVLEVADDVLDDDTVAAFIEFAAGITFD